jgi:hypothetical protein
VTPAADQSRSVRFGFASLEEIAPNGTVVQLASLQDGLATQHPGLYYACSRPLPSFSVPWFSLQRLPHTQEAGRRAISPAARFRATRRPWSLRARWPTTMPRWSTPLRPLPTRRSSHSVPATRHHPPPAKDAAQLTVDVGLSPYRSKQRDADGDAPVPQVLPAAGLLELDVHVNTARGGERASTERG